MVGDNRETDILFGNTAGISTLCVLSGVTVLEELEDETRLKEKAVPTFYSKNLYEWYYLCMYVYLCVYGICNHLLGTAFSI